MQPLSAVDAVAPAYARALDVVKKPRRWRWIWKFCLVAYFAQLSLGTSANFNPLGGGSGQGQMSPLSHHAVELLLLAGAAILLVVLVMFYVSSRLQFVLFEMALRRAEMVKPIWRHYGPLTWRWIGLKLLFMLGALLVLLPLAAPLAWYGWRTFGLDGNAAPSQPGSFLAGFLLAFLPMFLLLCVELIVLHVLQDFGLPSMALEGCSIRETASRVMRLARAEPGQLLLYLLMKILVSLAGGLASGLCLVPILLGVGLPLSGLAYVAWSTLHYGSRGQVAAMITCFVLLGLLFLAVLFVVAVFAYGLLCIMLQYYALYFLGGRYPLLGSMLEPPAPAAPPFYGHGAPPPPRPFGATLG